MLKPFVIAGSFYNPEENHWSTYCRGCLDNFIAMGFEPHATIITLNGDLYPCDECGLAIQNRPKVFKYEG